MHRHTRSTRRSIPLVLLGLLALAIALAGVWPAQAARPVALATQPSDDDFFTQHWGNPIDMNANGDIDYWHTRTLGGLNDLRINAGGNGLLEATTANNDPRVWLRVPTPPGANIGALEGDYRPIPTSTYRYATVRLYVGKRSQAHFYWNERGGAPYGSSSIQWAEPGWNILTFDLTAEAHGRSGPAWDSLSSVTGFYFDPTMEDGDAIKIDFIRLSAQPTPVPIVWNGAGLSGTVDIYVGKASDGSDGALVASGVPAGSGQYTWNTSLAAGTYYVTLRQNNRPVGGSPLVLPVARTPILTITAPSYISGPDYATTVAGNPWDMSDPADVARLVNVVNGTFSNGIFSGLNDVNNPDPNRRWDPGVELNVPSAIDTSTFRYLTYRMRVDGADTPMTAPVVRLLWWVDDMTTSSTLDDIVAYEGWQVVSYDLTRALLEPNSPPWASRKPLALRLDPHEDTTPRPFFIDYVMLTGNDQADDRFAIRYQLTDDPSGQARVRFYYDRDASGYNGQAITCASFSNPTAKGKYPVYLPGGLRQEKTPVVPSGESCTWNTSNVAEGTYYIYAVVTNGPNTYRVYSQTPVEVAH